MKLAFFSHIPHQTFFSKKTGTGCQQQLPARGQAIVEYAGMLVASTMMVVGLITGAQQLIPILFKTLSEHTTLALSDEVPAPPSQISQVVSSTSISVPKMDVLESQPVQSGLPETKASLPLPPPPVEMQSEAKMSMPVEAQVALPENQSSIVNYVEASPAPAPATAPMPSVIPTPAPAPLPTVLNEPGTLH
jgi:hypothetical protein